MKKMFCFVLCLLLVSVTTIGCQKTGAPGEQPQAQENPQPQEGTQGTESAPPEEGQDVTSAGEIQNPASVFPAGIWTAIGEGTGRFYFFDADGSSGRREDFEDGEGVNFSYKNDGEKVTFSLDETKNTASCKVTKIDEKHLTLEWEGQPKEELSFYSPLDYEHFHFYTNEELCRMAIEDYEAMNGPGDPAFSASAGDNEDATVTIQIYQILSGHNSNAAWYRVDRGIGEGNDVNSGDYVDLTKGSRDIAITYAGETLPEKYYEFKGDESEYSSKVLFTAEVPVEKFNVVALDYIEHQDGNYKINIEKTLYSLDILTPEKPLLLRVELPEAMPTIGVTYIDRDGANKLFILSISGVDGSPLLTDVEKNIGTL